ncbi:DUF1972 domain-containing protein [Rhodococcus sp. IEGM 1366]|uniref:DUF1972 domain-containing protein n=1 Tax=Rhodococcus sp. IEGM 1366 TaxID=3082223 RepID=UPI002954D868|nr:DUF1972 domain-containing protein [Rhodococcus sp. IEGM 1366]MDV8069619.1 DUF1972 domain-containing protein [Rhodococcus sp. IEGM 1366]
MKRTVSIIGTRGYPSYYGGFETLVRRLAPYLADNGWDVSVYGRHGTTRNDDPDLDNRVESIFTAGLEKRSLSTLTYGLTSSLDARKKKPDVALIMNVANGYWLPILKTANIPTVLNVDGIEWDREKWGRAAKATFRTGAKLSARYADHLIADSTNIADYWKLNFNRESTFIPYGGSAPQGLTAEPGLTAGKYALIVARFVPENTVAEFLDAAQILAKNWDVVIVGSSGYGGQLDERAQSLSDQNPRIKWLGHVSDDQKLFSLWQNAGAYFHGHSVGGTNPALVQAMACGAPTVARDTVYNREVLAEAAYFVKPTVNSISSGLQNLLSSPLEQRRLGNLALTRAQQHYTWDLVCQDYASILEDAADRGHSTRK